MCLVFQSIERREQKPYLLSGLTLLLVVTVDLKGSVIVITHMVRVILQTMRQHRTSLSLDLLAFLWKPEESVLGDGLVNHAWM